MSKQRKQLEKVLDCLINEEYDQASELLHNVFVAKAREIHEQLMAEDDELIEDEFLADYDFENMGEQEYFDENEFNEAGEEEDDDSEDMNISDKGEAEEEGEAGDDMDMDMDDEDEGDDMGDKSPESSAIEAMLGALVDKGVLDQDVVDDIEATLSGSDEGMDDEPESDMDDIGDMGDEGEEDEEDEEEVKDSYDPMLGEEDEEDEEDKKEMNEAEGEVLANTRGGASAGMHNQNQGQPRNTDVDKAGKGRNFGNSNQSQKSGSAKFSDELASKAGNNSYGNSTKPTVDQMRDPAGKAHTGGMPMNGGMNEAYDEDVYEEIDLDEYEDIGENYFKQFHTEVAPQRNGEAGAGKFVGQETNVTSPIPQRGVNDRTGGSAYELPSTQHSGYDLEKHPNSDVGTGAKKPTNTHKRSTTPLKKQRNTNFDQKKQAEAGAGGDTNVTQNNKSTLSDMGKKRAKKGIN